MWEASDSPNGVFICLVWAWGAGSAQVCFLEKPGISKYLFLNSISLGGGGESHQLQGLWVTWIWSSKRLVLGRGFLRPESVLLLLLFIFRSGPGTVWFISFKVSALDLQVCKSRSNSGYLWPNFGGLEMKLMYQKIRRDLGHGDGQEREKNEVRKPSAHFRAALMSLILPQKPNWVP